MKRLQLLCWSGLLAILTGCATSESFYVPKTGDMMVDARVGITQGAPRDKVLWEYRLAAAAMRRAQFVEAKQALDDALARIGNLFGPDKDAKKSRSYFREESKKSFIGEPYERVMAYYYRGILYWMDGEPDNARACFRSAQLQDSDTENKEYGSDYVLLDYLDGLASMKLSADGSDAYKSALKNRRLFAPPPLDPAANVLVFVEIGQGPSKYGTGEYGEELRFLPGRANGRRAQVRVANQVVQAGAYDDLTFQATTRGGRVMDHILANKTVFKSTADAVGNVSLIGGAAMAMAGKDTREAGLALAAFGLVSKIVSAATTPSADIRTWENLPQYLGFAALRLAPGEHVLTVEFLAEGGMVFGGSTKTIKIRVPEGKKDTVVFISDQSPSQISYETN
jgi:tetratricopeptide (TPR) repeat protein